MLKDTKVGGGEEMVTARLLTNCSNIQRNIHTTARENIARTLAKGKAGYFFVAQSVLCPLGDNLSQCVKSVKATRQLRTMYYETENSATYFRVLKSNMVRGLGNVCNCCQGNIFAV